LNLSVEIMILIPIIASAISILVPKGRISATVTMIMSTMTLIAAISLCWGIFYGDVVEYSIWYADSLSAIFVMIIAVISFMTSIYSYGYIARDVSEGRIGAKDERFYYMLFNIFVAVMFLTCLVSSAGLLWIAIEATTLVSAFLVGLYRTKSSTEAAWKYLMLCSAGITLALVGITLVYAASIGVLSGEGDALDWPILYNVAANIDPAMMKIAFVFIMIGFGTKIGLVPLHTWLPDAHGQAPTPVSAMLSAVLLNCALYGLIRFKMIADITVPGFTQYFFIGFGLLSLIVAAFFIMNAKDIKRLFAYSSIEHMGIILIGLGIGSPIAVFGALFLVIAHSLSKSFTFFSVGNIISEYGTKEISEIRGLRKKMPFSSFMLTAGMFAMVGLPPFTIFIGEITILQGAIDSEMYLLAIVVIIFILIVFAGSARNIFPMMSGTTDKDVKEVPGLSRKVPLVILLCISLLLGLFMPDQMHEMLQSLSQMLSGGLI
jgi:Formate hydrogenlyase subunit 3/Multisubunit Na+/H+ antiporter, MnhD subunit